MMKGKLSPYFEPVRDGYNITIKENGRIINKMFVKTNNVNGANKKAQEWMTNYLKK